MGYVYIALTILLSAYGQLVLKWRMKYIGDLPSAPLEKIIVLLKALFDPYIFSSFFSAFLASLTWMLALSKFELSYAYPFMSITFVVVTVLGYFFLQESLTSSQLVGLLFIIAGIIIIAR